MRHEHAELHDTATPGPALGVRLMRHMSTLRTYSPDIGIAGINSLRLPCQVASLVRVRDGVPGTAWSADGNKGAQGAVAARAPLVWLPRLPTVVVCCTAVACVLDLIGGMQISNLEQTRC